MVDVPGPHRHSDFACFPSRGRRLQCNNVEGTTQAIFEYSISPCQTEAHPRWNPPARPRKSHGLLPRPPCGERSTTFKWTRSGGFPRCVSASHGCPGLCPKTAKCRLRAMCITPCFLVLLTLSLGASQDAANMRPAGPRAATTLHQPPQDAHRTAQDAHNTPQYTPRRPQDWARL